MASESLAKLTVKKGSRVLEPKRPTPKHIFPTTVSSFVFLHDDVHIVSGSYDGTMHKWNCETGLLVGEPWKGDGGAALVLVHSPDGKMVACGRRDGSVQRWDTNGAMIKNVWTGHTNLVRSLSWSPSGKHVASGSYDETIIIRNVESGEIEVGPINANQGTVWSLAYSPSGDKIASGGANSTICIWSSNTGKLLVGPIDAGFHVRSVVWSSDNRRLYSASDKFARVFDTVSGKQLHRFRNDDWLHSIAL
jgi:WD40 repeat protein